jgi:Flp pilus assembly protein TadG
MGFVRRFVSDTRGVSAIEFAVCAPVLLILILGTIELALDMVVDASVQAAAQQASRVGLTTSAPGNGVSRTEQAKRIVNSILAPWASLGTVSISEKAYANYNAITSNVYSDNSMGGFGDVVSYTVTVTMPSFTGLSKMFGYDQLTFQRNFIVQNEK